jgi:hypothetical protein
MAKHQLLCHFSFVIVYQKSMSPSRPPCPQISFLAAEDAPLPDSFQLLQTRRFYRRANMLDPISRKVKGDMV